MFAAFTPKIFIFGNHAVGDFHVITMTEQHRQVVYEIAGAWCKISSTREQNELLKMVFSDLSDCS